MSLFKLMSRVLSARLAAWLRRLGRCDVGHGSGCDCEECRARRLENTAW